MDVKIQEIEHGLISNVKVMLPEDASPYKERFFEWVESDLKATFKTCEISGGVLQSWHHTPEFSEIEYHIDKEIFYFVSGTAIMLFMDIFDSKPIMDSAQIVKISAGTQILINEGKGHFVAVANDSEPVHAIVVAPKMDAPRIKLSESVMGVI